MLGLSAARAGVASAATKDAARIVGSALHMMVPRKIDTRWVIREPRRLDQGWRRAHGRRS